MVDYDSSQNPYLYILVKNESQNLRSKMKSSSKRLRKNNQICVDDISDDDILKRNQEFKNQRMNISSFMNETQEFLQKRMPPPKKTTTPAQRRVVKDEDESHEQVFKKRLKRVIVDDDDPEVEQRTKASKPQPNMNVLGINLNTLQLEQKPTKKIEKLNQLDQLKANVERNKLSETAPTKRLKRKGDVTLQVTQEDQDNCSICSNSLAEIDVAVLPCKHIFCFECALRYGEKYKNSCPLCRKKYTFVTKGKRMKDGDFIKMESVRVKVKRDNEDYEEISVDEYYSYSEGFSERSLDETSESDSFIVNDNDCEYCGCAEDLEQLKHCSKCQIRTAHFYCLTRAQRESPEWLCSNCDETQRKRSIDL